MFQQQPSSQPTAPSPSLYREENWGVLWREALVRADGSTRPVPDTVEDAIKRLQNLQSPNAASSQGAVRGRHSLAGSLKEYIDTLRKIEKRDIALETLAPKFPDALFTYISSNRGASDFKRFVEDAEMPEELTSIRDEIFARESPRLFWNIMKIADSKESSPELSGFSALVLECFRYAELPTVWESVKIMAKLFATGHATEREFLQSVYDAENRSLIPGSILRTTAENLFHEKLTLSREGEGVFFRIGSAIVERSGDKAIQTWSALISHPAVEFGFLKQRAVYLAPRCDSRYSQALLYEDLKNVGKYLTKLNSKISHEATQSIQAAILVAITRCEASVGAMLLDAGSSVTSLPWGAGVAPLFRECARAESSESPSVAVALLKAALRSKWVAQEIADELRTSERIMVAGANEDDKKRCAELVGGFYSNLRQVLREERLAHTTDTDLVRRALRIARSSPRLAQASLKELMGMLGIPGLYSERFGFICLPGITKSAKSPEHRASAREAIRPNEPGLGWLARWRLWLFDRQQPEWKP